MSLPALVDLLNRLETNEDGDIDALDMRVIISALYADFERLDAVFNLTLLSDGSRSLDPEYSPTGPKSIVDIEHLNIFKQNLMTALQTTGGTMTGALYLLPGMPVDLTEAANKAYVDFAIAAYVTDLITSLKYLEADGSIDMAEGYTPSQPQSIATAKFVNEAVAKGGNLYKDGSVDMDAGYTPDQPQSIQGLLFFKSW